MVVACTLQVEVVEDSVPITYREAEFELRVRDVEECHVGGD